MNRYKKIVIAGLLCFSIPSVYSIGFFNSFFGNFSSRFTVGDYVGSGIGLCFIFSLCAKQCSFAAHSDSQQEGCKNDESARRALAHYTRNWSESDMDHVYAEYGKHVRDQSALLKNASSTEKEACSIALDLDPCKKTLDALKRDYTPLVLLSPIE